VQITASAVSLNVADVPASAAFLTSHFGFRQEMAADGFASPNGVIVQLLDWNAPAGQ
jgi:catechol 2,3-dioxygenase-like lactoylglutathione lyase family enzyme